MNKLKITLTLAISLFSIMAICQTATIDGSKYYRITNKSLGESQSLTVTQDGALMNPTVNNLTQYWRFIQQADGTYKVFCFAWGDPKVVDIEAYSSDTYTLQFTDIGDASDQLWAILPIAGQSQGYLRFINKSQTQNSMSTDKETQELVELKPTAENDTQYWKITELTSSVDFDKNKYYRITNNRFGKSRSLDGGQDGVLMNPTENSPTQYWRILKQSSGLYKLQTTPFGEKKVMDIINDGVRDDKPIMVDSGNAAGQFWFITKNEDGSYVFNNSWQTENVLSCDWRNNPDNETVYLESDDKLVAEKWTITEVNPKQD